MSRHAIVTGAGSGVGLSLRLARENWQVALLGRREEALRETAALAPGGHVRVEPCDVADLESVNGVRDRLRRDWEGVDAVVSAAGTNVTRRGLADGSPDDFSRVLAVNLVGAFHVVQAFLPMMRRDDRATIVAIVSDAALAANVKAGAAYAASKFGLAGLVESINAEFRQQGVRATAIFPGDIDTPLLDLRPARPSAADRSAMLQPEDVAECAMLAINLPHRAVLEKIVVRPR
jgi:NAD(P)-dependent dehydrogenase (short-subunit alcohol dehydrogenase family)